MLARAYRAMAERPRRDIERHGLGQSEFAMLETLYHKGALTLGDVGEKVLLTSGSTTYIADKLERRGYITRRPCSSDRRVIWAEITPAGKAVMDRIFPPHAEEVREALASLSEEEQRQAIELLKRLGRGAAGDG